MKILTLLFLLSIGGLAKAQDLIARVQVLSPKIQTTNKRALDNLQTTIREFLNGRKWSSDNVSASERIDCIFTINITDWDNGSNFKAEAIIQSSRPVYGSTYNSTILNISDKDFNFSYAEGQPLDYSDQTYNNNLGSLLAFYSYVIIGLDYDSFSKFGGSNYFEKAQNVVNNAQNASFSGWKAFDGLRNRYWLSENLNNRSYNPIREALYDYHRNGLDIMYDNQAKGRKQILGVLPQLQKIDRLKQGAMLNQVFFTAKADELINIIKQGDQQERNKAFNVLTTIDPTNSAKYDLLKAGR